MDARSRLPTPVAEAARVRDLARDLSRARIDMAVGRLTPGAYSALTHQLEAKLRRAQADAQARVLANLRGGRGGRAN